MAAIGKKLRSCSWAGGRMLMHWCPGCESPHGIRIDGGPPVWSFDNNYEEPTFGPSVLCFTTDKDGKRTTLCHYFIKKGRELNVNNLKPELKPDIAYIDFCSDSPHALAGKTVELPDWPYAPGEYGGLDEDV